MAVLGDGGVVRFRRETPNPILVPSSLMRSESNLLLASNQEFWNGDEVYVYTQNGLPLSVDECPGGVGYYAGSKWELGANRIHVSSDDDLQYKANEGEFFYNQGVVNTTGTFFIHRDNLDRISFYRNRPDAINGRAADRVDLRSLDFEVMLISAIGSNAYNEIIKDCAIEFLESRGGVIADEIMLENLCENSPAYLQLVADIEVCEQEETLPCDPINGFLWKVQGGIREWSLDLEAASVSTTSVGQKFGESVKSIVTGGGSFDFIVERTTSENQNDSTTLMRLLLMTEKGSKAEAEFYMIDKRDEKCGELASGDLYYESNILVTSIAISTRVDDVIVGTAQFVTTGAVELRMGL
jgi:hypothetical protein